MTLNLDSPEDASISLAGMNCWVPTLKAPLGHPACLYAPLTGNKDSVLFLVGGIWRDGGFGLF